nr:right-handed parallel beta-helix repeat-containing protein [Actinomycetota bacterium]
APPPAERPPERSSPPSAKAERVCDRMVAPWGSDSASGKPREPFRGVGKLVKSLRPGWTGCLRGGTYTKSEVIVRQRKVTLRSAPGERATWRGRIILEGRRDKLVDLVLDGSYGRKGLPNPTVNAPGVVVSDSDITNTRGICVNVRTWRGERPDGFVIQRNRIHDCGRRPPTNHDHGIYVVDGVGGLIRDNVIFRNADRGVQLYPSAHDTTVVRNTIDGNGSGVIISNASSRNLFRENLISYSVERWNAESHNLTGRGNRFEANCLRAAHPRDPGYDENGGVVLPPIVHQADNVVIDQEPYRARASGDYTPAAHGCPAKGARGPARKPR